MAFSTHTSVNGENQLRKSAMVYLRYSFIVCPFLILHCNMTMLQQFVEISASVGIEYPKPTCSNMMSRFIRSICNAIAKVFST